jgi:hypothetical protein
MSDGLVTAMQLLQRENAALKAELEGAAGAADICCELQAEVDVWEDRCTALEAELAAACHAVAAAEHRVDEAGAAARAVVAEPPAARRPRVSSPLALARLSALATAAQSCRRAVLFERWRQRVAR